MYNFDTFKQEFALSMKHHKLKNMIYMKSTGFIISTGGNNELVLCNMSNPEPEAMR